MELLRRTWWTVVHSQQKSLAVNICVLPLSGSWSYRAIDWTVSIVGPVDLEFAARQSSWPRTRSWHFQTSAEDIPFREILTTKFIQRIADFLEYALYKFTLYLLTYFLVSFKFVLSRGQNSRITTVMHYLADSRADAKSKETWLVITFKLARATYMTIVPQHRTGRTDRQTQDIMLFYAWRT